MCLHQFKSPYFISCMLKELCKIEASCDEELPSGYIEEFRSALDVELSKYIVESYPKGVCAIYCTSGKDIEGLGADFGLAAVISTTRHSPQNFWIFVGNFQLLVLFPYGTTL